MFLFGFITFLLFIVDYIDAIVDEEENIKPFKCSKPDCKASFPQKGNLTRHILEVHEGKKRTQHIESNDEINEEKYTSEGESHTITN